MLFRSARTPSLHGGLPPCVAGGAGTHDLALATVSASTSRRRGGLRPARPLADTLRGPSTMCRGGLRVLPPPCAAGRFCLLDRYPRDLRSPGRSGGSVRSSKRRGGAACSGTSGSRRGELENEAGWSWTSERHKLELEHAGKMRSAGAGGGGHASTEELFVARGRAGLAGRRNRERGDGAGGFQGWGWVRCVLCACVAVVDWDVVDWD